MRKLTKKISMLMVLAMLVGLFSGVVSASAASAWSFKSGKYNVAVGGEINMKKNEYADFDLLKDGKAPEGYTVVWKSSDEDVVWVNAKTGQLRADKAKKAEDGDKAVISATFTNTKTKKSATRSFTIVVGEVKAPVYTVEQADVTAELGDAIKFAPVVKNEAGEVVKFATHKSYNGYFLDDKAITNPWTPEAAGEYTVTVAQFASKADVADLAKAVRKIDVKVTVKADLAAEATGVKEITVYGDFAKDATFTVKKGTGIKVAFTATVAEDGKSAKLALKNRITNGVYTIACGDASVKLECKDEYPETIVIEEKGGVVAVSSDRKEAYAHYDVLNQYGESIRKTANVNIYASSTGGVKEVKDGRIVMAVTGNDAFIYGSQIVLNISAVGYAAFESAILTAGLEDCVDAVKIAGITLADSGKILEEAPVSFLGAKQEVKFYLLFQMLDRSGHVMKTPATTQELADAKASLFFASLNPMLIKEFGNTLTVKRIDGVEYLAVEIVPGLQLKKGGVAPIEIRSNKTGGATEYDLRVVSDQVLAEFNILPYEDIIVKDRPTNDWPGLATIVDLTYEALDTNGESITDFRALYDRVYFSDPNVKLAEQWDGSAKLTYTVPQNTSSMNPTKEFDVPVVINAIVPEGHGNNVTLYVKEARYASGVDGYYGNNTILEDHTLTINLGNTDSWVDRVQVVDQYDDVLKEITNVYTNNEGKNTDAAGNVLPEDAPAVYKNTEYYNGTVSNKRAKRFAVKVMNGGTDLTPSGGIATADGYMIFEPNQDLTLTAAFDVTDTVEPFVVEFVLVNASNELLSGTAKTATFYVADISQATGFSIAPGWPKDLLLENKSNDDINMEVTAYFATGGSAKLKNNAVAPSSKYVINYSTYAMVYKEDTQATKDFMSAATGNSAYIKTDYYEGTDVGPLKLASQFNNVAVLNPDGTYGNRNVNMSVSADILIGAASGSSAFTNYQLRDTVKTTVEVGGYERKYSEIILKGHIGNPDAGINPNWGTIDRAALIDVVDKIKDNYGDTTDSANEKNKITVTISNLKENLDTGLKYRNLVLKNNVNGTLIEGVEAGDTFTATYEIPGHPVKLVLNFTVGPDNNAFIGYNQYGPNQDADDVIWY